MELVLIRHALPIRLDAVSGPADPPLDELGQSQARALAEDLGPTHLDALYTSPLLRARETAQPIEALTGLEAGVVDGVAEWDRHATSYVPIEQLRTEAPEVWRALASGDLAALGIDVDAFVARVVEAMTEIATAHAGQRVGVVCHGGVINVYLSQVLGLDRLLFFPPSYTSVSRVAISDDGRTGLLSLNETGHLRRMAAS